MIQLNTYNSTIGSSLYSLHIISGYITQLRGQTIETDGVQGRTHCLINIELINLLFYPQSIRILKTSLEKNILQFKISFNKRTICNYYDSSKLLVTY